MDGTKPLSPLSPSLDTSVHSQLTGEGCVPTVAEPARETERRVGGSKSITLLGSTVLLLNNACGPGLALLMGSFQQSGLIAGILCTSLLVYLAYSASKSIVQSIENLRRDDRIKKQRVEYLDLIHYYCDHRPWLSALMQVFYYSFLISLLISNIVQTSQVIDFALVDYAGHSYGFQYYPLSEPWLVIGECSDGISPFECSDGSSDSRVISAGMLICSVCTIPVCLMNLSSSIIFQYLAAVSLALFCVLWTVLFVISPQFSVDNTPFVIPARIHPHLPPLPFSILSTNFFNLAFICTVPSWLNEKQTHIRNDNVFRRVCSALLTCFLLIGVIGGWAFQPCLDPSITMLDRLNNYASLFSDDQRQRSLFIEVACIMSSISVWTFPLCLCTTSIPIYSVCIRYNLLNDDRTKVTRRTATVISIVIPFLLSVVFYYGSGFSGLCNWAGILLSSTVNFQFPLYFHYCSLHSEHGDDATSMKSDRSVEMNPILDGSAKIYQTFDHSNRVRKDRSSKQKRVLSLLILVQVLTVLCILLQILFALNQG